jgi:cytochrome d ubiquinol oxidase subunit II
MFPYAYATTFSAFYTAFILLLFALIFRAVSMEFRGKMQSSLGRAAWDAGFCLSSLLATFLFGVAGGNVISGLALDQRGQYVGSLAEQLRPYPLAVGLLLVSLFALHGGLFLQLKVGGTMADRARTASRISFLSFAVLLIVVTTWTLLEVERATENFRDHAALWLLPVAGALAVAFTGGMLWRQRPLLAFFGNAMTIAVLVGLLASALFPNIINATDPAADLRIVDAASSSTTLTIGLIVVLVGMPFVLTYTAIIYWTFRGRTELGSHSY